MTYRFSQLVVMPSQKDPAGSPASGLNRLPDNTCIDFEKSNIRILLPSHHTMRKKRTINTHKSKTVQFYKGQPVKIFLEIHKKHPIAEGASLLLSSPYLMQSCHADESADHGKRLMRIIRTIMKWRPHKNRGFLLPATVAMSDEGEFNFKSIDVKSDDGAAIIDPKKAPEITSKNHLVDAQVLFRYLLMDQTDDKVKIGPLVLKSEMLNQTNPNDPFLRISLKQEGKSLFHMGLKLPAEYWRRMIFLFAKPSYADLRIHLRGDAAEMTETVVFYRSDAGLINMSAVVEKRHRAYIKLEFIASNMCLIRISVDELKKNLETSEKDNIIINLRFVDQITDRILTCYVPVRVGYIATA